MILPFIDIWTSVQVQLFIPALVEGKAPPEVWSYTTVITYTIWFTLTLFRNLSDQISP